MPKKSPAARKAQAVRRSQTATRSQNVALVRVPGNETAAAASATPDDTGATAATPSVPASTSRAKTPAPTSAARATTSTATRPAATSAKPAAKPTAPQGAYATREQERRVARAKEMRRIRESNMVTAEHYRYVISDLRLTGILAAGMFAVIIVLHFVLG